MGMRWPRSRLGKHEGWSGQHPGVMAFGDTAFTDVTGVKGGRQQGAGSDQSSVPVRERPELPLSPAHADTARMRPSTSQEGSPHQGRTSQHLDLGLSASKTVSRKFQLCKWPGLWPFVMVADEYTSLTQIYSVLQPPGGRHPKPGPVLGLLD